MYLLKNKTWDGTSLGYLPYLPIYDQSVNLERFSKAGMGSEELLRYLYLLMTWDVLTCWCVREDAATAIKAAPQYSGTIEK